MWGDWNYWPMPHFFFGPLIMLVFFGICMITMMWMMRGHCHSGSGALDILNERYTRGEIDQAEHEEQRRVLRS
jgi:putative membrane protein